MIVKTEGISINYIRYRDTSIIARVFTRHYGLQSLVVNGIRSKNSRKNPGFFEPFSVLELVLYWNKQKDIHRISEFRPKHALPRIRSDLRKSTMTLFLSEVLSKILLSEKHENTLLYEFLEASVVAFDEAPIHFENFHIQFLLKLSAFLGFGFDYSLMRDQVVSGHAMEIDHFLESLSNEDFFTEIPSNGRIRSETLDIIIQFYQHHIGQLMDIKSLEVLKGVFK